MARSTGGELGSGSGPTPANAGAAGLASETWATSFLAEIPDQTFARLYFQVNDTATRLVSEGTLPHPPSFFEVLTALAFLYYAEEKVDIAVLEVGLGGRLDATNIVTPTLSVITDIALDHQEWLGATLSEIAREKAGILRPNGILVTLPQHPEANQALGEAAVAIDVRGVNAAPYTPPIRTNPLEPYQLTVLGQNILVDSPLRGAHQHRNLALAIAAAVELQTALSENRGAPITARAIEQGIRQTQWPARLETLHLSDRPHDHPEILLDVAHNPAGAWALRAALSASDEQHMDFPGKAEGGPPPAQGQILIFSCLRDKPLAEMAQILFPIFDHIILAPIHSPRATPIAEMAAAAEATGTPHTVAASIAQAIQFARAANPRRIVISGSLYLVGEARARLVHPNQPLARQFTT